MTPGATVEAIQAHEPKDEWCWQERSTMIPEAILSLLQPTRMQIHRLQHLQLGKGHTLFLLLTSVESASRFNCSSGSGG